MQTESNQRANQPQSNNQPTVQDIKRTLLHRALKRGLERGQKEMERWWLPTEEEKRQDEEFQKWADKELKGLSYKERLQKIFDTFKPKE